MRSGLLLLFVCLFFATNTPAQQGGLRSPKDRLHQIDTDTVRVIYPEGLEGQAQRVANIFHKMAVDLPIAGNDKLRKISVLLQNKTDVPNGYVGLAPWRSEFFLSPSPNSFQLGSLPWGDLLSIHEFRHVQQRSAARRGVSGFFYYLMGEQAFSVLVNMSWPNWYTEGDAVIAETTLSNQGRGRLPAFLNAYRTEILDETKDWSYMKARNGSYRELVPSHYDLGFLMMDYGRQQYGQGFWDEVALNSASYNGLVYPFSQAVRNQAEASTPKMYRQMLNYYRGEWSESANLVPDGIEVVKEEKGVIDFAFPVYSETGQLYAVSEAFHKNAAIVQVNNDGTYDKEVVLGYFIDPYFSYGNGKFCWTELREHPRWIRENFNVIMTYDIESGKKKQVTSHSSYFSPALNASGEKIVALHDNDFQEYSLHILDAATGEILDTLANPDKFYYTYPVWLPDNSGIISAVRDTLGQMALIEQRFEDISVRVLNNWSWSPIGRPYLAGEFIYYSQSDGLVDRIHRVPLGGGTPQVMRGNGLSDYAPVLDASAQSMVYAEYSLEGKKLHKIELADISFEPLLSENPANFVSSDDESVLVPDNKIRQSSRYRNFSHPLNIHSWNPFYDDPVFSIDILSENVLQSIFWNSGYQVNFNNSDHGPYTNLTISTFFPELKFGYEGWRRVRSVNGDNKVRWFAHNFDAGFRLPVKGYHGPYRYTASLTTLYNYSMGRGDFEYNLQYLSNRVQAKRALKQAYQHPMSRLAQAIDMQLRSPVDTNSGYQFQVQTDFTFPGFLRNDVLWFQADYRTQSLDGNLLFSDIFIYSRGYSAITSEWIYRLGFNYHLPVAYPDVGAAGIAYLKRLRTTLFFDYSKAGIEDQEANFNSTGIELIFDCNFLNVQPFSFGLRFALLLDEDPNHPGRDTRFEFFLPTLRF